MGSFIPASVRARGSVRWVKGGGAVEGAESFFVESLEAWREAKGLERMTLAGHSMGGYMAVAYSEKYPHRVDRLVLLSPVGVPDRRPEEEAKKYSNLPLRFKCMLSMFRYTWSKGITPGSFLRFLPESRGRSMAAGYVTNRLPAISSPEEREALTEYLYANSMLPGSGEFCLDQVLEPGAFAKRPTLGRIPQIDVPSVGFIYGQSDWMDPMGGVEVRDICDRINESRGEEDGKGGAPDVEVFGVKDAGHLLMLENWEGFNNAVLAAAGGGDYGENKVTGETVTTTEMSTTAASNEGRNWHERGYVRLTRNGELSSASEVFSVPRWSSDQEEEGEKISTEVDPVGA